MWSRVVRENEIRTSHYRSGRRKQRIPRSTGKPLVSIVDIHDEFSLLVFVEPSFDFVAIEVFVVQIAVEVEVEACCCG